MGVIEEKFKWDGQLPKPSNMKFSYEDANALSNAFGGGGATLTVAASNALHPERYDKKCSGIADEVEIAEAIAELPVGGGSIRLSEGIFCVDNPIVTTSKFVDIGGASGYIDQAVLDANVGTRIDTSASFPTNRFVFENIQGVGTATQTPLRIHDLAIYNTKCASPHVSGAIRVEGDDFSHPNLVLQNVVIKDFKKGLLIQGISWGNYIENVRFWVYNSDFDVANPVSYFIKTEIAGHSQRPALNHYNSIRFSASYRHVTSALQLDSKYDSISNLELGSGHYTNILEIKGWSNTLHNIRQQDVHSLVEGGIILDGAFDTYITRAKTQHYAAPAIIPSIVYKNNAARNFVEVTPYGSAMLSIDDTGAGTGNVIVVLPGHHDGVDPPRPTSTKVRILDYRYDQETTMWLACMGDNTGVWACETLADAVESDAHANGKLGHDYGGSAKLKAVVIPDGTGIFRYALYCRFGVGSDIHIESYAAQNVAVTSGEVTVLAKELTLTDITPDDIISMQIRRYGDHVDDTVNAAVHALGGTITYNSGNLFPYRY